jgi:hypothetical protein
MSVDDCRRPHGWREADGVRRSWVARGVASALMMAALVAAASAPASASVGGNRYVKSVKLTVEGATTVTVKGNGGQCLITRDGYNLDFEAEDYPSLGTGGSLASGGPGPETPKAQRAGYAAFTARIDGAGYVLDDAAGDEAISDTVKLSVKKRTITFDEYPIVAVEDGEQATVSGTVKCKAAAVR